MPVNSDKPQRWKIDIARSVDLYNDWFIKFAPQAYRSARAEATVAVENALKLTKNLTDLGPSILRQHPSVLQILRMSTAPPIARDRLIGLARARWLGPQHGDRRARPPFAQATSNRI